MIIVMRDTRVTREMSGITVNLIDNGALCLVRDFVHVSSSLLSLFVVNYRSHRYEKSYPHGGGVFVILDQSRLSVGRIVKKFVSLLYGKA